METAFIIGGIVIVAIIAYILIQKSAKKKPEEKTPVKIDNPPTSNDKTVYLDSSKVIDKNNLEYSDIDGDKITHVRFLGDVSKLSYYGDTVKGMYQEYQELPIDTFKLYVNIEPGEEYQVKYQVKSNNIWSK